MAGLLRDLDRLLRGDHGVDGADPAAVPVASLVRGSLILGVTYGLFMGIYAATRAEHPTAMQIAVSAVKVPALFLLTLTVTFPSLYVFSALSNSPLRGAETLRLLLGAITVNLALLASFGPVTGFFTMSTDSYPFMVLLNVLFFGIAGLVGLTSLRSALARLHDAAAKRAFAPPPPALAPDPGTAALDAAAARVSRYEDLRAISMGEAPDTTSEFRIFRVWIVIYGAVGVQMAWILRPFVGTPGMDFAYFRPRGSNFFIGVMHALQRLFE